MSTTCKNDICLPDFCTYFGIDPNLEVDGQKVCSASGIGIFAFPANYNLYGLAYALGNGLSRIVGTSATKIEEETIWIIIITLIMVGLMILIPVIIILMILVYSNIISAGTGILLMIIILIILITVIILTIVINRSIINNLRTTLTDNYNAEKEQISCNAATFWFTPAAGGTEEFKRLICPNPSQ